MLSDRGARIVAQVGHPVRFHLQPDFLMQLSNKAFAEALVAFVQTPKESPSVRVKGRLVVTQVEQDHPRLRIEQKSACPELRSALDELYVRHSPILLRPPPWPSNAGSASCAAAGDAVERSLSGRTIGGVNRSVVALAEIGRRKDAPVRR